MVNEKKTIIGEFVKVKKIEKKDGSEELSYSLIQQSLAAEIMSEIVREKLAWDPVRCDWKVYQDKAWIEAEEGFAERKISQVIRAESMVGDKPLGCSDSWWNGTVAQMRKGGMITRPTDEEGKIPFKNGLLAVDHIGEEDCLEPINYKNAMSWCLPYDYNPLANCTNFLDWLGASVNYDAGTIKFIRAFINALLVGRDYFQFFLHVKGLPGTGKSTLVRIFKKIIGDHATVSSSMERFKNNRFEYIRLFEKRLFVVNETPKRNDLRPLKEVTGGDPLVYELKGGNKSRDFRFKGLTVLAGNDDLILPPGDAGAIARRIRIILFNNIITKKEQNSWLERGGEEKILYQDIPGIISWALGMDKKEVDYIITNPPESISSANKKADIGGNGLSEWISDTLVHVSPQDVKRPVWVQIGSARKSIREGIERYGVDPTEDEQTKLFASYLAYCREKGYRFPITENFPNQVCITANRLFGVDYIHRPLSKSDPNKYARRKGVYGILNIRILKAEEMIDD